MEQLPTLYQEISQLGFPGGMALFIFALYKKWIVWGSDCQEDREELKEQRDQYKVIADKRTTEMEERLARLSPEERG